MTESQIVAIPQHMMNAVRQHSYGESAVLRVELAPRPQLGAEDILIRVHAAGINPVDWKTRRGQGVAHFMPGFPLIPGWDVSGVVVEVGAAVSEWRHGDEVYGMLRFPQPGAAYAEYASAPAAHVARKPVSIDHIHAAALPLAALTAWQALFDTAALQPGQRVLVHAASGGVGHLAVQLAKWRGARVLATTSAKNADLVRSLGADEVIDYTVAPFEQAARELDLVLDCVGGDVSLRSLAVLRPGGLLVSIVGFPDGLTEQAVACGLRAERMLVRPDQQQLIRLAQLVDGGQLRPVIAAVFSLAQAAQAHELGELGRTVGKLVLQVAE